MESIEFAWILVLVGCGAGQAESSEPPPPAPIGTSETVGTEGPRAESAASVAPMLDDAVADVVMARPMFEGWTVVPFAQVERGDRIAVALWPAIDPEGAVVDDDVIGVTLSRGDDGALTVVDENWSVRRSNAITSQLEGEPTTIRRGEGVPADELAERLCTLPARFAEHVRAGDREAATETAVAYSRLFAYEIAVLDDAVAEILGSHLNDDFRIEADAPVTDDDRTRVRARFFQGEVLAEVEDLIATPVDGDTSRWVFTGHERVERGAI